MGYTHKVLQGFSWHSFFLLSAKVLSAVKLIVLARLLAVNDFGLYSLTTIALGITEAFTQTGVNIMLIQSKKTIDYYLDTAWVIAIVRGTVIGLIMMLLALLMGQIYHEPKLLPLITLAAFVPFIKGFINPYIINMQKQLSFFWDTVFRLSLNLVDAIVAISLCLLFKSVFMLIFAMLITAIFEVIISFIFFEIKPKLKFNTSRAKDIFAQMKGLNLSSIFSYLQINLDNILIGKVVGTTGLGFYYNAFQLSHTPNYELSKAVLHSSFPVFTKIGDDRIRLKKAFLKTAITAMTIFTLASLPLLIFPQLMIWLFSEKWLPAVSILRPLVVAGLIHSFALVSYTLWYAQQKYKLLNFHLGLNIILMVMMILLLTPKYGLIGAGWGVLLSRLLLLPLLIGGIYRTLSDHKQLS